MNREMRRMQEREERLQKKGDSGRDKANRRASAMQSKAPVTERRSLFARLREYLHEVRQELRKVTWPTREQMVAFTTVTLITSVVLTGVIFGLDIAMKEIVFWLVARS
ncbi:MAG TPA: preprotein translocase subunit SecE [Acidimicrobiia bacterium]|nr:preprotein translocase subunit SecE [Acidimicrobiia bacterium]